MSTKKKIIIPLVSGVLAGVLCFVGFMVFKPKNEDHDGEGSNNLSQEKLNSYRTTKNYFY